MSDPTPPADGGPAPHEPATFLDPTDDGSFSRPGAGVGARETNGRGEAWRRGARGVDLWPDATPAEIKAHARGRMRRERAILAGDRYPGDGLGLWTRAQRRAWQRLGESPRAGAFA